MANYSNLKAAIAAAIKTNGNQEITGQVLQDVLTSMVSVIGANYTFAGVATPSTNPGTPDQNLTYLAMEGGTYTNFNGTVLPAGISLLMWNGTWMSETVMYGDGGVFDISVYKSSGGTLAKFADLAAALDGGNNIPTSARKGGMSVKFVQSSVNKYYQFRYMSSSTAVVDFTNVANWQGVDDEPTSGSENLVKSGGIWNSISIFRITVENAEQNPWYRFELSDGEKLYVVSELNRFAYLRFRYANSGVRDVQYGIDPGENEIDISNLPSGGKQKYVSLYVVDATEIGRYCYIAKVKSGNTLGADINLKSYIRSIVLKREIETLQDSILLTELNAIASENWNGWIPYEVKNGETILISSDAPNSSTIVKFGTSNQSSEYEFREFPSKGVTEVTATADTNYVNLFSASIALGSKIILAKKQTPVSLAELVFDIKEVQDNSIQSRVFYVGTGRPYTTIKAGVEAALEYPNSIVYIERGTYDIIQEWGQSVLDNQTETIQNNGIRLYNGIHLIFSSDAKVVCNYTGNNQYACNDFAPFNSIPSFQDENGGFTIENMNIECSRVRYCVHDERGSRADDRYKHVYKNCKFYIDNSQNPSFDKEHCIGTGLGRDGYIIVDGCEFSKGNYYAHNTSNVDAKSKIVIKDSFFADNYTVNLTPYGTTAKITECYITNCRLGGTIIKDTPPQGSIDNIRIVEWNNIVATS